MYFLKGKLPWQGLQTKVKKEKYEKIMETKIATPIETLCKGFPGKERLFNKILIMLEEFAIYLNYCRSLRFEDRPDYNYLKRLFKDLFWRTYTEWDFLFDWVILNSVRRELI